MGLVVTRGEATVNDADIDYKTEAPREISASPGESVVVTFSGQTSDGVALRKSYTFKNSAYVFDLDAEASAATGTPVSGIGLTISQPLAELEGYRDYPILQADVNGKALTEAQKALEKGVQPVTGPITYAGFGDRYFLAAFLPQRPTSGTVMMDYQGTEADARLQFNGARSVATQVYMGPKELQALEAVNPSLSKAIDLGFWGIVALPFLRALKFFYRIAPNYGVAIILLTVVVRLLTLPMSIKGQRSMMRMQRLQPQVQRIRDKFKDDQERLNREMVELYKRNHVNPVGGCLPMVIQFPVFIGLYEALLNAVELRHAPFIGWIRDLSAPDCLPIHGMPAIPFTDLHGIPILVILMTLTAFIQQWISPRNPDPSQQKMMMYMPVMFSLIFIELPAGLSLYYFASNLLGVIQQFILNREFKQYTPVATT
jgi:YidC/Oxa1 family membrane protein insertase